MSNVADGTEDAVAITAGAIAARRPVILSVDDDPRMRSLLRHHLAGAGHELHIASSGAAALEMVARTPPDLILLDVRMPDMDGYAVCSMLQSSAVTASIPVVFVTALGDERDKVRAFLAGAVDYLVKPFDKVRLLEKVRTHLQTQTAWKTIAAPLGRDSRSGDVHGLKQFTDVLATQERLAPHQRAALASTVPRQLYPTCAALGIDLAVVAQHIAEFMRVSYLDRINPNDIVLGVLPTPFCRTNHVVALADAREDVAFAISNPFDWELQDVLSRIAREGRTYRLLVSSPDAIDSVFETGANPTHEASRPDATISVVSNGALSDATTKDAGTPEDLEQLASQAQLGPIVQLASSLIARAIQLGASDIHIEPRRSSVGVRYRIDGMLQEMDPIPKEQQPPLVSRLKIMGGMDIAVRRLPQDGRILIQFRGRNVDMRMSTLPSVYGEKVVIRILDSSAVSVDFDALGFDARALKAVRDAILKPHGLFLVTGPTGSGKTSTLYTALQALNDPQRNIVTVEDPVEYEMHRITQIQVRPEIGLTFAAALRSVLRQDPDVVMVGEIRDRETMEIAVRAALTGHLVLSTLHTNDAASTVARLIDMGSDPCLIAASLELVVAQRLMRKLCLQCRQPDEPTPATLAKYGITGSSAAFFRAVGCPHCNGSGYRGRVAAVEALSVDDPMRRLITQAASAEVIASYAIKERGMTTIRENALARAAEGITSLDEVIRVTG